MNIFKKTVCLFLVLCTLLSVSACAVNGIIEQVTTQTTTNSASGGNQPNGEDESGKKEDILDNVVLESLFSYNATDYIGDFETFAYGLLITELQYLYDVFPAYVQLSDASCVYGLAYTDYSECYTNEDESVDYFMSGFLPFIGELEVPQEEFDSGLYLHGLDYEDEETVFVWAYRSEAFLGHCVVYGGYLQYGVSDGGYITCSAIPYEREKCDTSLGALYSYDECRYLYDVNFGQYEPIGGESLSVSLDYEQFVQDVNAILEEQNENFMSYDITTVAYEAKDAVVSFLLSMQTESFLGYSVAELIALAEDMSPLECLRVTPRGLTVVDIQEVPPEEASELVKWLVGGTCVVIAVVGAVASYVALALPPPYKYVVSTVAGAASGAAIDLFLQVVIESKTLANVSWTEVGISAFSGAISGLLSPCLMGIGGWKGFVADTAVDALIAGVENLVLAFTNGASGQEALAEFGYGCLWGAAVSAGLKGVISGGAALFKKAGELAEKVAKSVGPKLKATVAKFKSVASDIGNAIADKMNGLIKKSDNLASALKHNTKKNARKTLEKYIAKNSNVLDAPKALVEKTFKYLKKDGLLDAAGNAVNDFDAFKRAFSEMKNGDVVGKYILNIDGEDEVIKIIKRNGVPDIEFDLDKYWKVFVEGGLTSNRTTNFKKALDKYKQLWKNGDFEMPKALRDALLEMYPDRTIEHILDNISYTKLKTTISKIGWVLHEGIDGSISLVPKQLHDKTIGGISHMGGKAFVEYLQQHFGLKNFDDYVKAAANGFKFDFAGAVA